jgi:hypothetical protein
MQLGSCSIKATDGCRTQSCQAVPLIGSWFGSAQAATGAARGKRAQRHQQGARDTLSQESGKLRHCIDPLAVDSQRSAGLKRDRRAVDHERSQKLRGGKTARLLEVRPHKLCHSNSSTDV